MSSNKVYWKSVAQLDKDNELVQKLEQNEFVDQIPVDEFLGDEQTMSQSNTNRRDFSQICWVQHSSCQFSSL